MEPAFEAVRKSLKCWIQIVRPSRRPLRGLLRMRTDFRAILSFPHPEERPEGASRRTHDSKAAVCDLAAPTPSHAGVTADKWLSWRNAGPPSRPALSRRRRRSG